MSETVYVLTHEYMPGLVKIGMTTHETATERVKSLSAATGVPGKFRLEAAISVDDAHEIEQRTFSILREFRIDGKEFFKLGVGQAKDAIMAAISQARQELNETIRKTLLTDESSKVDTIQELGQKVRNTRKSQGLTQKDLAMTCNTGLRFIIDLEAGKPTARMDKVLDVVNGLGIKIYLL